MVVQCSLEFDQGVREGAAQLPAAPEHRESDGKGGEGTAVYDNWEYRNKAIYLIFYKGYSTLKVANELHFSEVTIKRWKSEFVNKVGYFAGF